MRITVTRVDQTDKGIFGKLEAPGFSCVTLENDDYEIPVGSYRIELYNSPAHGRLVMLLQNVPGRTYIEIHPGNFERDSKGCLLLGLRRVGDTIEGSKIAVGNLFAIVQNAIFRNEEVWIDIA